MLLAVLVVAGVSCSDDDDVRPMPTPEPQNLVETAQGAGLTTLLDAVEAVDGLGETLLSAEAITVFAPTNEAFGNALQRFDAGNLEELVEAIGGVGNLEIVLGFHFVPAVAFAGDLAEGEQTFTTLGDGQEITVTSTSSGVTVTDWEGNVSNVVTADVEISNGVVHVIDAVLIPELELPEEEEEEEVTPNLVEAAQGAGLTTLLAAVDAIEGLGETLLGAEAITVFAPTNDAFEDALEAYDAASLPELVAAIGGVANLELILGFHVVPAVAFADDLMDGEQTFPTLAGDQEITVTKTSEGVTVTDFAGNVRNVVTADVEIENGVVHVIDGVLLPELKPTLVEAAQAAELTTLLAAVDAIDGLGETLLGAEAITVFAPTNDAFEDALEAFDADNLEELVAAIGGVGNLELVLGFHVVPAVAFADDLAEGSQTFETLGGGQEITVTKSGTSVTVTDAAGNVSNVVAADVEIVNGVVHVIDAVLLPELPEETTTVSMTVGNDENSAYFVNEINPSDAGVTNLNENNSTWTLEVGTRYVLTVTGASAHPFEIRNSEGDALLSMDANGSFESDPDVNFETSGTEFSFTLTQALADEIADYICTVHGSMVGDIVVQ